MVYATPIMWDLLDDDDRKILTSFVRACIILTTCIIENDTLDEAHSLLLMVARLIEENYEQEMVTPNIHLSLHLTECCKDYDPLYSYWCYLFERINDILGKLLITVKTKIHIY
jgi:hypothetical protein